ncbi:hypothetical protein [Maioricimonas rarisocia]|uniref:hypothetical protein n=1 Tax=Maioricimonas rarisocia TaxID=2528026 RepID=UPI0011A91CB8|nr:hypothetical protein [Maioricimonas rarisocia]
MKLKADELKSARIELGKVMKGRALYFGLMAPSSKKGKFKVSKLQGDVKPPDLKKSYKPYEDEKDNDLKGSACQGVVTGDRGVMTLHVRGKAPGAAVRFLQHLVQRVIKYKKVREIKLAETDQLPEVPPKSPLDDVQLTAPDLQKRLEELRKRADSVSGEDRKALDTLLNGAELKIGNKALDDADLDLDDAEDLLEGAGTGTTTEASTSEGSTSEASTSETTTDVKAFDPKPLEAKMKQAKSMIDLIQGPDRKSIEAEFLDAVKLLGEGHAARKDKKIVEANGKFEEAEDELDEVIDLINGAYQDFFLDWLKGLQETEKVTPFTTEIQSKLDEVKGQIRSRSWTDAMASYQEVDKLVTALGSARRPDAQEEVEAALDDEKRAEQFRQRWTLGTKSLRSGIETTNSQLSSLAIELVKTEDPNLIWVGEEGIGQLLRDLREAVNEIDRIGTQIPERTVGLARPAMDRLRTQIKSEQVAVCDKNAFKVSVSIRSTMNDALSKLEEACRLVESR